MSEERLLPVPPQLSQPFWDACRRRELVAQRCAECARFRHYPTPRCPSCQSDHYDWAPLAGRGEVYSYTVCHQAFHPYFADTVPYVLATVELEEGIRMLAFLPDLDPAAIRIGMPLEVCFEQVDESLTLPCWQLCDEPEAGEG